MKRTAAKIIFMISLMLTLASCYVPDKFKAEIQLGNDGSYALSYYGDLIWAPLFRDIRNHVIDDGKIQEKIDVVYRDLARDKGFKSVTSLGEGRFNVEYHHSDLLRAHDLFAFVRRNAAIIQLRARPDGRVLITGRAMLPNQAVEATKLGATVSGEFRITTAGHVLEHNATNVMNHGQYMVYIWKFDNVFSPPLYFVMQRDGNWNKQS